MIHKYFILMTALLVLPLSLSAQQKTYVTNGFMFLEGPPIERQISQPEAQPVAPAAVEAVEEVTVSEVTSPEVATTVAAALVETPKPEARPEALTDPSNGKGANPSLYDMRGCTYKRGSVDPDCYGSMSTVDRARRIMHAVNYINKLHETKFDGRYMLCTGYRESNFNPGAKGADGERGMFQVMKATGRGALRYGVELPEFNGMNSENYMTRMANSTVAQVELSFLVLKMKLTEMAARGSVGKNLQSKIMSGNGSVDHYRTLAGKYNGGGYGSTYAKRISNCYSCLRGKMSATATNIGREIQPCLNKAK